MTGKTVTSPRAPAFLPGLAIILLLGVAVPAAAQYEIYDLGYSVTTQDIQADNSNTVHIVWTYGGALYYGKIADNAITGKVQVASGISTIYWRPYVSVQPDGSSVHIVWTTAGMGNTLMHSWRSGGAWDTETVLKVPSSQWLSQPACAVDSSDIVHVMFVIWNDVSTDEWSTIFYTRKLANGNWENEQRFTPEAPEHKHPMLFVASNGRVHATWDIAGKLGSDKYDAYYCTAPSGGKFDYADTVKLPKRTDCDVSGYGDLYVDRDGVVYRSIGGWSNAAEKMCIDLAKKPAGGSFQTPTRPSNGFLNLGGGDPVPAVVAAEGGKAVVAWGQVGSDGSNMVKASFYDPEAGDWSLKTIDAAAGIQTSANSYRVALTRTDSHIYCVWRGSNHHLKLMVQAIDGSGPEPPGGGDPVASFSATPTSGPSPLAVTFDGSASYDSDGTIVSYDWDFGDGSREAGAIVAHTYTKSGTYKASLTVFDDDGNSDSASGEVEVGEPTEPPVADFKFAPGTGIAPCEITFDAGSSHDPDGTIVDYRWSFGDGGRGSGRLAKHTYITWGTFSVSLTVRDNAGASADKVRNIEIRRLFQPLNIRWESHKDESLFQTRYVNNVSWERNPANDSLGVQIVLHRIWRKQTGESDLAFRLVGEVTGDVYSFIDKDAGSDTNFVYTVTVRDSQGHESPIIGGGGSSSLIKPGQESRAYFKRDKLGDKGP